MTSLLTIAERLRNLRGRFGLSLVREGDYIWRRR